MLRLWKTIADRGPKGLDYTIAPSARATASAVGILAIVLFRVAEGSFGFFFWVAVVSAVCAVFAEERWSFNPLTGEFQHRYGLTFLARTFKLPLSELASVTVSRGPDRAMANEGFSSRQEELYVRASGKIRPDATVLDLVLESGKTVSIDWVATKKEKALVEAGRRIASTCGKPFTDSSADADADSSADADADSSADADADSSADAGSEADAGSSADA